jgi:hypothetical protein
MRSRPNLSKTTLSDVKMDSFPRHRPFSFSLPSGVSRCTENSSVCRPIKGLFDSQHQLMTRSTVFRPELLIRVRVKEPASVVPNHSRPDRTHLFRGVVKRRTVNPSVANLLEAVSVRADPQAFPKSVRSRCVEMNGLSGLRACAYGRIVVCRVPEIVNPPTGFKPFCWKRGDRVVGMNGEGVAPDINVRTCASMAPSVGRNPPRSADRLPCLKLDVRAIAE